MWQLFDLLAYRTRRHRNRAHPSRRPRLRTIAVSGKLRGATRPRERMRYPLLPRSEFVDAGHPAQSWAWADGAQERTRTFTAVKPLAPEASASTNSATWARGG